MTMWGMLPPSSGNMAFQWPSIPPTGRWWSGARSPVLGGGALWVGIMRWVSLRTMEWSRYVPFAPEQLLAPGPAAEDSLAEIVALPGHTPGSIGVIFEGCLLAGDLVMNLPRPALTWLAEDFSGARESLSSLSARQFAKVYPGHGPAHTRELDAPKTVKNRLLFSGRFSYGVP